MLREAGSIVISCNALDRGRGAGAQVLRWGGWRLVEPDFNSVDRPLREVNEGLTNAPPDSEMKTIKYVN
jgi:hypothetical protein